MTHKILIQDKEEKVEFLSKYKHASSCRKRQTISVSSWTSCDTLTMNVKKKKLIFAMFLHLYWTHVQKRSRLLSLSISRYFSDWYFIFPFLNIQWKLYIPYSVYSGFKAQGTIENLWTDISRLTVQQKLNLPRTTTSREQIISMYPTGLWS